ncbi:MAG: hypothetical protein D3906_17410 [Candidatus Electrothrix sp. AUS1_2]|nr:hypothetical protein [Candidatus Electrothrix sp. AUS1_2]
MKALLITAVVLTVLPAASVRAEDTQLGFRNKTGKVLQLDCDKSGKGKTAYTCYDSDGNETYLNEGGEWKLIRHEKVCFRHQDDRIRVCLEITEPENGTKSYTCFRDGKPFSFAPEKEWELLSGENTICAEKLQHFTVPKSMELPDLNLE